jgi:hypothetical protein
MKEKTAAFLLTLVAVLEEAEFLGTVILDNSIGTIIPPQVLLQLFVRALEVYQTVSNNAY